VTADEFTAWVLTMSSEGRIDQSQVEPVLAQRALFDAQRSEITEAFPQQVVGFVRGERIVADSVDALLNEARRVSDDLIYFEPIGYAAFGEF
jgi:hypothetical protein